MENQMNYAEYLEHYGVKGMRWGIIRTPEQLGHKKDSKGKNIGGDRNDLKIDKKAKKKRQALERKRESEAKKNERRKRSFEKKAINKVKEDLARREKILSNPTLLYKHRKEFSPEEIKNAMNNIKMEQELRQISLKNLTAGQEYLEAAVKYAESGIKAYNTAAKLYNAFSGSKKPLPTVNTGGKKKNKDKNKDDDD